MSWLHNLNDLFEMLPSLQQPLPPVEPEKAKAFFGIKLFDKDDLIGLVLRLGMHMFFVLLLVRMIYYPVAKRKDFLFTYVLMGLSIFLMCIVLSSVNLDTGFALGLFAVFAIIRYRTDAIPIKEMTYLFVVIAMSVMNALINKKVSLAELLLANSVIVAAVYGLERVWLLRHESQKIVLYERIDLIQKGRQAELIQDLEQRTSIKINRVEIGKIDFLRDVVAIRIFFYEDEQHVHMDDTFAGRGGD